MRIGTREAGVGAANGGATAAVLFSFIATSERHSINPFDYLRDVLARITSTPISQLPDLSPHRRTNTHAADLSQTRSRPACKARPSTLSKLVIGRCRATEHPSPRVYAAGRLRAIRGCCSPCSFEFRHDTTSPRRPPYVLAWRG